MDQLVSTVRAAGELLVCKKTSGGQPCRHARNAQYTLYFSTCTLAPAAARVPESIKFVSTRSAVQVMIKSRNFYRLSMMIMTPKPSEAILLAGELRCPKTFETISYMSLRNTRHFLCAIKITTPCICYYL